MPGTMTPEQLRERAEKWRSYAIDNRAAADVLDECATEIERLQAECAMLDTALNMAVRTVGRLADELDGLGETGGWSGLPDTETCKAEWLEQARAELEEARKETA